MVLNLNENYLAYVMEVILISILLFLIVENIYFKNDETIRYLL